MTLATLETVLLAAMLFLPVAGISFIALRRAWEPQERALERLHRPGLEPLPASPSEMLFGRLTPLLAHLFPSTARGRAILTQELRAAGYYRPSALTDYLALRNFLVAFCLLAACALAFILEPRAVPAVALGGVVAALLAFSLPRIFIQVRGRNRAQEIQRGLPTAVDLLTLALTAGMNLYAALGRVAHELRFSHPVIAEEFDLTRRQAELRSLEHALEQLADRVRVPEMRNLAIILAQSERLGSDAVAVLLETSDNLRTNMRQRAETQANRASFWLLFPTVGCFLLAAALLIIGPVFLEFRRQMEENGTLLREGLQDINKIRLPSRTQKAPAAAPAEPQLTPP
jgi:tight adherence protein C